VEGCTYINNTDPCDDELFCNGIDTCSGGTCSFHPGDPCPPLFCDEDLDSCIETQDSDEDGVPDAEDNCPTTPNPNQEDTYPPQKNGIGDACDCEGNFDCDQDVDAEDVTRFLADFGRGRYFQPCVDGNPCNGDVTCDGDVDAGDVEMFLEDLGRGAYVQPCPQCTGEAWCSY
jgi:hypothetical protein